MKKLIYTLLLALPFVGTSCERETFFSSEEGKLFLSVGIDNYTAVATRADDTEATNDSILKSDCKIRVYSISTDDADSTLVRKYAGVSEFPADGMQLVAGKYSVRVDAGSQSEASFDKIYYLGEKGFTISGKDSVNVSVECKIQNVLAKVDFSEIQEIAKDYSLVLSSRADFSKSLTFTSENQDKTAYFILPQDTLYYRFSATAISGETISREEQFYASKATLYTLKCTKDSSSDKTGAGIIMNITSQSIVKETDEFTIYQPPVINATYTGTSTAIDLTSTTAFPPQSTRQTDPISIWFTTACPLISATVTFSSQDYKAWELPAASIGLIGLSDEDKTVIQNAGLTIKTLYAIGSNATEGQGRVNLQFSQELMNKMTAEEGQHTIKFSVTDKQGSSRVVSWTFLVSDDKVVTIQISSSDAWATKATLRGLKVAEPEDPSDVYFLYRISTSNTSAAWSKVMATINADNTITASVTGLTANKTYEYKLCEGSKESDKYSFTTEAKTQPENAGFENWTTGSIIYPATSSSALWWDTGNTGSSTMSKNITQSNSSIKHGGSYSAKLESQFVGVGSIGKFAAGNIFTGKYLKTDGTDGVLGFGRPFTSRPTKLKGYVRYEVGTVAYTSSSVPSLSKGDPDQGQIYIAVGDWELKEYNGEKWPVIIKTKSAELFDSNDSGIIAYGEKTFTESTSGDGMVEFEIPLTYRSESRKPTHIVIVCSSSKYGDYFAGGPSVMYIDDLELVYE